MAAPGFVRSIAESFERAVGTARFAGDANRASVMDELVGKLDPVVAGDDLHQLLLNLFRIGGLCEAEAIGEAQNMGVDDYAFGYSVGYAKDDIGSFTGGSGNGK